MPVLSLEVRNLIVSTYQKTKKAKAVATVFGVAESTVYRLAKQLRDTGSLELQTHKRGRKHKIDPETEHKILSLVEAKNDITLQEIVDELHLDCVIQTVSNILKKHKIFYKKKRHMQRNKSEQMSKQSGSAGRNLWLP